MTRDPELSAALAELIELTRNSQDCLWAGDSVTELSAHLESISARIDRRLTSARLELRGALIATGPLQELSISNGWGGRFVELAEIIENHLK